MAYHNDCIRGQGMLDRMEKMEAEITSLRESLSQPDNGFCRKYIVNFKVAEFTRMQESASKLELNLIRLDF